jgi:large subunit ribosomal protein L17e
VLSLLQNAQANAAAKGLDEEKLVVKHISAKQAPKGRRRTYRAHGRINPYMSQPSHVELVVEEAGDRCGSAVIGGESMIMRPIHPQGLRPHRHGTLACSTPS